MKISQFIKNQLNCELKAVRNFIISGLIFIMVLLSDHYFAFSDAKKLKGYSLRYFIFLNIMTIAINVETKQLWLNAYEYTFVLCLLGYCFYMYNARRNHKLPEITEGLSFVIYYVITMLVVITILITFTSLFKVYMWQFNHIFIGAINFVLSFILSICINRFVVKYYFMIFNPNYKKFYMR
jgi:hypothetical protein